MEDIEFLDEETSVEVMDMTDKVVRIMPMYGLFTLNRIFLNSEFDENRIVRFETKAKAIRRFMITQGFIAERHELPQIDGSIQIELTEAGRELKRSGMVGNYWIKKSKEQQDERQRQELNDQVLELTIATGKMQNSLLWINRWIAVATVAAVLIGLFEVLRNYYNPLLPAYRMFVFPCALALGILWLIRSHLRSGSQEKNTRKRA
jgi:hypothetical protein